MYREASRLHDPRVRRIRGLGLDVGRHLRVGVDARIGRVAGLSLDLELHLRGGRKRRGGRIIRADAARAARHSLHWLRRLPCSQMPAPPHSLHPSHLPCSQMRTPCTGFAASRARRSTSPRTPCTCFAASRARRCSSPRTPCTCFAASRARRCRAPALLALASLPPVLADLRAPALLARASLPPVLADPFPRALLTEVSSVGHPVRAQRTSRSLRLPRARSLAETLRHGVVSPRGALWPRPRGTSGSDERFIFLGRDERSSPQFRSSWPGARR